jgi:hypothetical protein
MSGSEATVLNKMYNNIERPYANVDLSKIPSWDLVMSIMEQQAMEARRQMMNKYQENPVLMPMTVNNIEYQMPYGYNRIEESDNSSFCSDEMEMDSSQAITSESDMSQSESDIEIDVDSIEENDDYFLPSLDNIPITVLQLESKIREKELQRS